ncbi:MAG: methyltransferase domain-containing protein [Bacteroidota bacterium]
MNIETARDSRPLFGDFLSNAITPLPQRQLNRGECQNPSGKVCTLCAAHKINYDVEYEVKNVALQEFWNKRGYDVKLESLIPSPLGRNYRTVTKRKTFSSNGSVQLGLIGTEEESSRMSPVQVGKCMIEPEAHSEIYRCIQAYVNKREFKDVAQAMNYVIVKGNYNEFTVMLNLSSFDSGLRQFVNRLSKHLTGTVKNIIGVFVIVDEKRSRYYMPQHQKNQRTQLQKIFGVGEIFQKVGARKFLYSPLSFSQTNLSIVEVVVRTLKELLDLKGTDRLFDLYCGYGLFSLSLADSVESATGIELSRDSVRDAKKNAERLKISNCKYLESDINEESLEHIFSSQRKIDNVILDPPRNGTKPGVVEIIAAKNVKRVLHIFCNIDLMPTELERWTKEGYKIIRAVPFDMFPGTSEVEIMVCLQRI